MSRSLLVNAFCRTFHGLLAVVWLWTLTGCTQSLVPWWPEEQDLAPKGIEGVWLNDEEPKAVYTIIKGGAKSVYEISLPMDESKSHQARGVFTNIAGETVLDLSDSDDEAALFRVPVHSPLVVELQEPDKLLIFVFEDASLVGLAKERGVAIATLGTEPFARTILSGEDSNVLHRVLSAYLSDKKHPLKLITTLHRKAP